MIFGTKGRKFTEDILLKTAFALEEAASFSHKPNLEI